LENNLNNGNYIEAKNAFQIINSKFHQNIYILRAIANCHYRLGNNTSAYYSYSQVYIFYINLQLALKYY